MGILSAFKAKYELRNELIVRIRYNLHLLQFLQLDLLYRDVPLLMSLLHYFNYNDLCAYSSC